MHKIHKQITQNNVYATIWTDEQLDRLYNKVGSDVFRLITIWHQWFFWYPLSPYKDDRSKKISIDICLTHHMPKLGTENLLNIFELYRDELFRITPAQSATLDLLSMEAETILGPYKLDRNIQFFYRFDTGLNAVIALRYVLDNRGNLFRQLFQVTRLKFGRVNEYVVLYKTVSMKNMRGFLKSSCNIGSVVNINMHWLGVALAENVRRLQQPVTFIQYL